MISSNKKCAIIGIVAITGILAGCSDEIGTEVVITEPLNIELTRSEAAITGGFNEFAFDLFKELNAEIEKSVGEDSVNRENNEASSAGDYNMVTRVNDGEKNKTMHNFLLSPLAVAWNFSMMSNAVSDQESLDEIKKVLHIDGETISEDLNKYCAKLQEAFSSPLVRTQLKMNSAFFYKDFIKIKPDFLSTVVKNYSPAIFTNPTNDDFDRWIASSTDGLINEFAERYNFEMDDFGVLNNMCFSGLWDEPFDKEKTSRESFRNIDGTFGIVDMMKKGRSYKISADDNCCLMKIYFQGGAFSVNFMIPSEGYTLKDVIDSMDKEKWDNLVNSLIKDKGLVKMPRFEMENDLDVLEVLRRLGVKKVFDYPYALEKLADFSDGASLSRVQQSVKASFDECGVKVASSAVMSGLVGSYIPSGKFFLDQAFCYLLTEESTGAILLMGKVGKL